MKNKKEKFERIVNFGMPYDKRNNIPDKDYGISSMRIWFILKGKKGAVQVLINTPFYMPETVDEYKRIGNKNKTEPIDLRDEDGKAKGLECWDVGFHSKKKPKYMDKLSQQDCNIIGKCYYDGSFLRGDNDKVAEMFLEHGEEAIWKYLEKYYNEVFTK